jgi:hypothetical protein
MSEGKTAMPKVLIITGDAAESRRLTVPLSRRSWMRGTLTATAG